MSELLLNRKVRLAEIFPLQILSQASDFSYADVTGCAEMIGWKIVLFRKDPAADWDALCLSELDSPKETALGDHLLAAAGFPLRLGCSLHQIRQIFGTEDVQEDFLEGCIRCCYRRGAHLRLTFELSDGRMTGLEILCSPEIIVAADA